MTETTDTTDTADTTKTTDKTETAARARSSAAGSAVLPKAYRPSDVEPAIYERWLAADVFAPDGAGSRADEARPPFVIIQPPPNVTGSLHLGHAQRSTVEDLMIRHARMQGRPTLWLPGLDHASIAAQYVLDRIIATSGDTRQSLGRERYLERMWEFINRTRGVMLSQQRRVGASLDWSRLRFTMDDFSARAVREAFTRLHREGLAYRTEALVNWCPGCRTSVSDLEVIPTEEVGTLWTVRYHFAREDGSADPEATISVATTRPETILGDTAVAVHPDDPRYSDAIGQTAIVPFVDRPVPVIADDVVDPAFGTGAVKVTPAHDPDDYATGKRHDLPFINVMNDDGTMNEAAGEFAGLDRYDARNELLARLAASGDLVEAKPHEMLIGRCQRSNDVIEPRLKTQWFVRTAPLAQSALEATRSGRTQILPERFVKVWEHWLTNIRDWNVSRQLWWGHRIPAWYCPDGHATVTADPAGPQRCDVCGRPAAELTQDPDIFDTWFSSGLWPFSTLGWPDRTSDLARFYPGSVMETAYDIIFFWVARMMMLGIHLTGAPPFQTVYLSGLVRDPYGQKMSKTKGNVVDPLETIDEFGADALRFALVNGTAPGNDLRLSRDKLENGRNFANKLWNAARFVLGARPESVSADAVREVPHGRRLGPAERWILSRAAAAVTDVSRHIDEYAFGEATRVLYEAIWSEFCDWGLELAKVRLADAAIPDEGREATWWTLVDALDTYLRLLHPVMPFVTESLWAALPHAADDPELLIVARWPEPEASHAPGDRDEALEGEVGAILELVRAVRNARAEAGVEPGSWLGLDLVVPDALQARFDALRPAIERLARARPLERRSPNELATLAGEGGLAVSAGGLDGLLGRRVVGGRLSEAARGRISRELEDTERQLAAVRARLADRAFVAKAPPTIVEGARDRESGLVEDVTRLRGRLNA